MVSKPMITIANSSATANKLPFHNRKLDRKANQAASSNIVQL